MQDGFRLAMHRFLKRIGLQRAAFRLHETIKALEPRYSRTESFPVAAADGLPVPPPKLIVLVGGHANLAAFLQGGEDVARTIRDLLIANQADIGQMTAVLDFGCGCGRVMRQWHSLAGRVALYGADYNRASIDWCRRNLPFAQYHVNRLEPPLDYQSDSFDLVYAFSVFTHLPATLQLAWIDELARITAPGGYLFMTVQGENFRAVLTTEEQATFDRGQLVVRHTEMAGSNLCAVFHPQSYVRQILAGHLQLIDYSPAKLGQDVILLRKSFASS